MNHPPDKELFPIESMTGRKPLDWTLWNQTKANILALIAEDEKKPKFCAVNIRLEVTR